MAIEWENGFVKRIALEGLTGSGWGISVQDSGSWFTLDGAARCTVQDRGWESLSNGYRRTIDLAMAEGQWVLTIDATSWRGTVTMRQRLQSLIPSRLLRMAIDLRFDSRSFDRALVGSQAMTFGDPAIWRQGPSPCVTLAGIRGAAWVRGRSSHFTQRVGVRAEPEGWIVHTECGPFGAELEGQTTAIEAGQTLELSVECELWAVTSEMPVQTLRTLQLV